MFAQQMFFHNQRWGIQMRVAVTGLVYAKALRLSSATFAQTTTGQLVNLIANDAEKFEQLSIHLNYVWYVYLESRGYDLFVDGVQCRVYVFYARYVMWIATLYGISGKPHWWRVSCLYCCFEKLDWLLCLAIRL